VGVDPRFYDIAAPASLAEIAKIAGAELVVQAGARAADLEATRLRGVAPLAHAGAGDLCYFSDQRYASGFETTKASVCLVRPDTIERVHAAGLAALVTPHPAAAFGVAAGSLAKPRGFAAHAAPIDPTADIDPSASLGPGVVVGPGASVGPRTRIGAGTVIGPGVAIGADCEIGPRAAIGFAVLGDRVRILGGAVIGEAGFGVTLGPSGLMDLPHFGRVRIGDDVSIGANTTIDRGMLEDTVIGPGAKIDNLVQIAHNCRIGAQCIVAGCCGLSGSVVLEDGVVLGGSVGIADHITVGKGAKLAGATLVMRDVPPGETWAGTPARPIKAFFREIAALSRLAERRGGRAGGGGAA
jgi:UDP-3-O-[3-hydroxymyristoyl] glucosamine N-acyltransferase